MLAKWAVGMILFFAALSARADATAAYVYDALGRVTQVAYGVGKAQTNVQYAYDEAGNRQTVTTTRSGGAPAIVPAISWFLCGTRMPRRQSDWTD
ncbi:RHS repeat domain-containing protein [Burkholderia alba]|uniref:RHS repeat domain-containing protein n=1 Tax=Burkholderia alba TaxID=2683677 RepID=UPI002B0613CC|nr:RHS repeat domain-containing protein [Burkholderia alba]